jgi:ubiquinone/menaquinone biosynthesis C-methylase UbiE
MHDGKHASDPRIGFFDDLADRWDISGQSPDDTVETVKRHAGWLGLRPGQCVLEVGCGTGQLTGWLAEQVRPGRVVAVDFSREMLRIAEAKGIAATFRLADVCQDDLGQVEFDVALCFHSFPHFRDQPAALRNLAQCLRPQGRLVVMHLHPRHEVNAFHHGVGGIITHDFLPDDRNWETWLNAAGFQKPDITDGQGGFMLQALLRR